EIESAAVIVRVGRTDGIERLDRHEADWARTCAKVQRPVPDSTAETRELIDQGFRAGDIADAARLSAVQHPDVLHAAGLDNRVAPGGWNLLPARIELIGVNQDLIG